MPKLLHSNKTDHATQKSVNNNILAYCFAFGVTLLQQILVLPLAGALLPREIGTQFIALFGVGQLGAAFEAGIGVAIANHAVIASMKDRDAADQIFQVWGKFMMRLSAAIGIPCVVGSLVLRTGSGWNVMFGLFVIILNFYSATLVPTIVGIMRCRDNQAMGVKITNAARLVETIVYGVLIYLKLPAWVILTSAPLSKLLILSSVLMHYSTASSRRQLKINSIYGIIRKNLMDRGLLMGANWVQFTAPIMLLNFLEGPQMAGAFAAARALSRLAWQPSIIMRSACSTECAKLFSRGEIDIGNRVVRRTEKKTAVLISICCVLLIAGAVLLKFFPQLSLGLPPKYIEAIGVASFSSLVYLLSPFWLIRGGCLDDTNQTQSYSVVSMSSSLVIVLVIWLLSRLGISHYAPFAYIVFEGIMFFFVRRKYSELILNGKAAA